MEKVVILGCGDIGERLARQLDDRFPKHYQCLGIRRNPQASTTSIPMAKADCTEPKQLASLLDQGCDVIVMTFTPSSMDAEGYHKGYVETVNTLLQVLKTITHQPRLILFVSSTSVYHQDNGDWVDETSQVTPSRFSGKALLEAERALADIDVPYSIVRFSGIYGPGRRRLIQQVIDGKIAPKNPVMFSNRIHADDCAGVLAHLIHRQLSQPLDTLYLATDCEPVPLHDIQSWIAAQLQIASDESHASVSNKGLHRSHKRCSNERLLATGYQFRYPTYREGYGALLEEPQ